MLSSVTAPADDSALDYGRGQSRSPPQNSYGRPRATTAAAPPNSDALSSSDYPLLTAAALNNAYQGASPSFSSSTLYRSASEGQAALSSSSRDLQKSPMPPLDPSQFPDPYPFRPHHPNFSSVPALSSAGSSSTRSSAYTSSGSALASGDYGHVHVATGEDDASAVGVGITSDDVVQLLAIDATSAPSARPVLSRAPIDQSRWSESYSSSSVRSRSSSIGNSNENIPKLNQKPSFDISWQTVDERDEVGMSEEETDDDQHLSDDDDVLEENEEERTSAAVVADEGRGLIVHGDNVPVTQLHVQPGTTHLLIGSSTTPNAMPVFLANTLPQIHLSLLALDISANFLGALPPVLATCENLEELNIASNPLRVLPVFLADLTNLRVLIADSTGINTLPEPLADLDKLHTISVRRNKLHALPTWLCLLPALQTLCVDGNPFQGPWKALVEPLLAKTPISPMYPPSTPIFPPPSASLQNPAMDIEAADTDIDDLSDSAPPSANVDGALQPEDHTITPERLPNYNRSVASAIPDSPAADQSKGLIRTRTTPNRAHFDQTRAAKMGNTTETGQRMSSKQSEDPPEREVRKMKSAGDLRRGKTTTTVPVPSPNIEFGAPIRSRPGLRTYGASLSSSNLLNSSPSPERPASTKRFASLGPASSMGSNQGRPSPNGMRPQLTRSLWDNNAERDEIGQGPNRVSYAAGAISSSSHANDEKSLSRPRSTKEKGSRWGFLKKMSMGKMKPDPSTPGVNHSHSGQSNRFHMPAGLSASPSPASVPSVRSDNLPQIDMRFSTTGTLDGLHSALNTPSSPPSASLSRSPSTDLLKSTVENNTNSSPSLLMPPSSLPRASKRRSFLPIDAPGAVSLNIPIPDATPFVPGLTVANGTDDSEGLLTPSTPAADHEHIMRREAERSREAYMRALRSVMAYLKDMNDLSLLQQPNSMSVYGTVPDDLSSSRSRRPTVIDNHRDGSHPEYTGQLRSSESIAGLRSGTASQTLSVATTDSTSSQEERERKFKDDKGKRAMVVREIVLTERTYVKGLQELVDIYIKPASVPVNILSGVGSGKDTVVPAAERRLVFGGVEALFTFHKDNFLPALEVAAAPLMKPSGELQHADADGQLSLAVVRSVASMFLKHAAFMKMYSSYINNFDSSVQRVKYWSSDRNTPGSASPGAPALSPSSSTAQLVGLGLSMTAVTSPNLSSENNPGANGVPNLTSGQRKRIKSYLKRCRMNPRHSQLNLEGYLLLPVQRIPRYRLLLEELHRSTPPSYDYRDDPLDRALAEISSLASNMNEGKREAESRRKLVRWQSRIRGRFPSPLVQPHRRLIMDGPLLLTRVVRKATVSFEAINAQGDAATVQVDCLAPELTPRPLIGILCNDLLVLCRDPSEGQDPASSVDLWAVLRMQTLPQPASIVHGNALRLVDNKAILYFDAPSPSDALNWYRAINLHIPASKA